METTWTYLDDFNIDPPQEKVCEECWYIENGDNEDILVYFGENEIGPCWKHRLEP